MAAGKTKVDGMSETKDTDENKSAGSGGKTLSLRRTVESGHVRQNFSHGRSKSVLVEKKRKRTVTGPGQTADAPAVEVKTTRKKVEKPAPKPAANKSRPQSESRPGVVLRTLTEEEKDARARAVELARGREAEERKRAEEENARRASEEDSQRIAREAAEAKQAEEERLRAEEEAARIKAEEEAARQREIDEKPKSDIKPAPTKPIETARPRKGKEDAKPAPSRKSDQPRRVGRLTIAKALDDAPRQRSLASIRRRRERERQAAAGSNEPAQKISRDVVIPEVITIQELANRMAERSVDVIKLLMKQGQMFKINDIIDTDTAQLVVEEMGHTGKTRFGVRRRRGHYG